MEFRSTPEFGSEFRSAPELNSGVLLNSFKSLDRQASQSFRCNRHTVFNGRQMASRLAAARTVNDVQTPIQACLPMLLLLMDLMSGRLTSRTPTFKHHHLARTTLLVDESLVWKMW